MRSLFCPIALVLLFAAAGCTGNTGLAPVTGTVTMDDQPLPDAIVVFAPAEGGRANSVATTDADGKYTLVYAGGEGTQPGKYNIIISKSGYVGEREVQQIPAKYNDRTDLTAEVTADGENTFDFHLQSGK